MNDALGAALEQVDLTFAPRQGLASDDAESAPEGCFERGTRGVLVECISTASDPPEARIARADVLHDHALRRDLRDSVDDSLERDPLRDDEMVNNREKEDEVESAARSIEKGGTLVVHPASARARPREVHDER